MKQIKWDFSLKAWGQSPRVDLGVGPRPKLNFLEYGHVAYQIKANSSCSNMVANILPTDTSSTPGQNSFFLKIVMLHIELKGIEHRAP